MQIRIDDLDGITFDMPLAFVGAVYEEDDVIYFNGAPFRLSSARPAIPSDGNGQVVERVTIHGNVTVSNVPLEEFAAAFVALVESFGGETFALWEIVKDEDDEEAAQNADG